MSLIDVCFLDLLYEHLAGVLPGRHGYSSRGQLHETVRTSQRNIFGLDCHTATIERAAER